MRRCFFGICVILLTGISHAAVVRIEALESEFDQYGAELLLKVLNYGDESYTLKSSPTVVSHSRDIVNLQNNVIDVLWAATSIEHERHMLPIRIPIFKGLIGYRVFVIRPENSGLFESIKTLSNLKDLVVGQGQGWVDSDILRVNGFQVVEALNVDMLYGMLKRNRFDGVLRGIQQPWTDVDRFKDDDIIVEKNILVGYPLPMYFFVNKNNKALAELIENNFERMIEDGSFDLFFYNNKTIKYALENSNISERTLYQLKNPFLPSVTPLTEKKYWYDVNSNKPE